MNHFINPFERIPGRQIILTIVKITIVGIIFLIHKAPIRIHVIDKSQNNPRPVYQGPTLDVSRVDKLKESKWAIDQLAYELDEVSAEERDTDDYRFRVKQIVDNYLYLIYATYEFASSQGPRHAKRKGPHHNSVYQQTVQNIWQASLRLLMEYETEFPYDTAMRADSVTVLYSNLAEMKLMTKRRWAKRNPLYVDLFDQIGRGIPK